MKTHDPTESHLCEQCGKSFHSMHILNVHQRNHNTFACPKCDKVSKSETALRYHLQTHGPRQKCPLCPKTFARTICLKSHLRVHAARTKCPDCGVKHEPQDRCTRKVRKTVDPEYINQILETIKSRKEKKHECNICGKEFTDRVILVRHKSLKSCQKKVESPQAKTAVMYSPDIE